MLIGEGKPNTKQDTALNPVSGPYRRSPTVRPTSTSLVSGGPRELKEIFFKYSPHPRGGAASLVRSFLFLLLSLTLLWNAFSYISSSARH